MRERTRLSAFALSAVLAVSAISVLPVAAQEDGFDFEPLLMPYPAGDGMVINGYNDQSRHQKGDLYGLDLCDADGCRIGDPVLAPTTMTLVYSGNYNNVDGDPDDFHIFEIDRNEAEALCLSLAHFDLTADNDGTKTFERGAELGTLLDYRFGTSSVPHYHISLWTVAGEHICAVRDDDPAKPTRFPSPSPATTRSMAWTSRPPRAPSMSTRGARSSPRTERLPVPTQMTQPRSASPNGSSRPREPRSARG